MGSHNAESDTLSGNRSGSEVQALWKHVKDTGLKVRLQQLHERSSIKSLSAIVTDWMLIFAAFFSVDTFGLPVLPIALVVIGSRQRAMVVLAHDASHYSLHPNRRINDLLARILLCYPMFLSFETFRDLHTRHHRHLGDAELDTDYLHSGDEAQRGWWNVYSTQLLSFQNWLSSGIFLGAFRRYHRSTQKAICAWWGIFLCVLSLSIGVPASVTFLILWIASRAIVHHAIISFVILSDHVGLRPDGTILNFARNHSCTGLLRHIIHPHNNGFHLTHHLLPGLPFHALGKAHELLLTWPPYANAEHCTSYFSGAHSAISSWCGDRKVTHVSEKIRPAGGVLHQNLSNDAGVDNSLNYFERRM